MPKIHELAVVDSDLDELSEDLLWKVNAYKEIFFNLSAESKLLLEKLVSELEYEAELAAIDKPRIDFSLLQKISRQDLLQTTPDQSQD